MKYIALKQQHYTLKEYSLVPLREEDIYKIKDWRNSQISVLRQKRMLTEEDQKNYYTNYVLPTFAEQTPSIILFSFLRNGSCIGYGGLTNIDWESKRIELSFLVDPLIYQDEPQYGECFSAYLTLIKQVVFDDLGFNRIFTETYDIRPFHISILEKNGFRYEGRMKEHVVIEEQFIDSLIHGYLKEYYYA